MCVLFFFFFLMCYSKNLNNMFGCVKIMPMHAYGCIDIEFIMDVNYMSMINSMQK